MAKSRDSFFLHLVGEGKHLIEKTFNFEYHRQNETIRAVVEQLVEFLESSE